MIWTLPPKLVRLAESLNSTPRPNASPERTSTFGAEITCGVPPRSATRGIPLDGMRERRKRVGHMRGVPPDTATAFKCSRSWR